jgi:hypothetical protein
VPRQRPVVRAAVALALLMLGGCGASGGGDGSGAPAPKVIKVTLPAPDFGGELWLSALGFYGDIGKKELAPDLIAFEPAYALWADGAEKLRWLRLPEGKTIDTSDMDHWVFPVGTYAFKEFTRGGKRMETRVIARTGPGPEDYWLGSFAWKDDESDALFVPGGRPNVRGTAHDIPKVSACGTCHKGEGGRILGYSSVQQPDAPAALVSHPPDSPHTIPGGAVVKEALGYLHANCGHCHNPNGAAYAFTDMVLRYDVAAQTPEDTNAYRTAVGRGLKYFKDPTITLRISPGKPDESAVVYRMGQRSLAGLAGAKLEMPPLATEVKDEKGLLTIRGWIESL